MTSKSPSSSASRPGTWTTASCSGWRVFVFVSTRILRPSSTTARASAIDRSSADPRRRRRRADSRRGGPSPASRARPAPRFRHSSSATKGTKGARRVATVTRQWCRVCAAASASAPATPPGFQKRRLVRRTYQFERSLTKDWIRRPAPVTSYASSRSRASRTVSASCESTQRSITARRSLGGAPEDAGSNPFAFAYVTKNEYTFQRVSRNWRTISSNASNDTRRSARGDPLVRRNQRRVSAPCRSSTSNGSMLLPSDFDIFRASASRISPRHTTFR